MSSHFIFVYSKSSVVSIILILTALSKFVSPNHLSGVISWLAYTLVPINYVGFLWSAKNPPKVAISPSRKVGGKAPLNKTIISFLKSVITNLFSRVPFLISIEPAFTTPDNLNLYPGKVECIAKNEGVTVCWPSAALFAYKNVPKVKIKVP